MTRKNIMQQIKEDLEDNLTTAQGYSVQPVVIKQGIHMWSDFEGQMPSLHFTMTSDEPYEDEYPSTYSSEGPRVISIIFYGYAENDGEENSETIYQMAEDIESFLLSSHFTHADNTLLSKLELKESGVNDSVMAFNLEVRIIY